MASTKPPCWEHRRTRLQSRSGSILSLAPGEKGKRTSTGGKAIDSFSYLFRIGPPWESGSTVPVMTISLRILAGPSFPGALNAMHHSSSLYWNRMFPINTASLITCSVSLVKGATVPGENTPRLIWLKMPNRQGLQL
jgi:hypothetical protein